MITISKALQLVYNYTEQQAQAFLSQYKLEDEYPNPLAIIEERIEHDGKVYYDEYDWIFCVLCDHYEVVAVSKLTFTAPRCSKCGGRMV